MMIVQNHSYLNEILTYYSDNKAFHDMVFPTLPENFYTLEFQSEKLWIEFDKLISNRAIRFYIYFKNDVFCNQILGDIAIYNIESNFNSSCEIGFAMNKDFVHQGIMTASLSLALNFIKNELNLRNVLAYCLPQNIEAINLLKKLNFKQECIVENYISHKGVLKDYLKLVLFYD